jgi:hypothetical protein
MALARLLQTLGQAAAQSDELVYTPQPSSDAADPLNWAKWRKIAVLVCMSLYAAIANFTAASIASAFPLYATPLAFNPPVPIGRLTHLIAVSALFFPTAELRALRQAAKPGIG